MPRREREKKVPQHAAMAEKFGRHTVVRVHFLSAGVRVRGARRVWGKKIYFLLGPDEDGPRVERDLGEDGMRGAVFVPYIDMPQPFLELLLLAEVQRSQSLLQASRGSATVYIDRRMRTGGLWGRFPKAYRFIDVGIGDLITYEDLDRLGVAAYFS